ncbi:zinc finger protein 654 [Astyanax mexicanus]|uniref:zinc finger protein 654 n=1 Tax=Astyanax mexicanus TaxID=7994 RepID=UPI0020CB443C|nr:zinc finger protein 654 [Astyanax mexicanus]
MAEEESEVELDRFKRELRGLVSGGAGEERGLRSGSFCTRFCELVEDHTSRWQVPLPQLQVLRSALCAFVQGAASFPSDCEHVRYTLSSLALSVFELLLFFGKDEFPEDPLKDILDSFQECHSSLVRYQNVYLLQVRQIIKDGGPWASSVLHGILKELEQPQEEVDRYLSSEVSVFFELRVRYLLACERNQEALALAQRCSQHPTAGKHLFFKQAYLSCLRKTSQQERLFKEMAEVDAKDAVEILCIAENEEKDEFVLELSRGFLSQQLRSGDMYYLWDLVFIWCKLYLRVKASKQDFLKECKDMILSAANIKAMFPFMKVILEEELGRDGLTFCVELCARALQTDLKNDPDTKSLIYKTIAYLLPSDLEICRACALLVFFLERTVEAYKTVFLLYTHPDQEYHLDSSPIGNHVRFEVIRILKKGLFFDPEFWNLLNIKTNCLKLMSDSVAKAALCEIMEEDKWVPNYCARGLCRCHTEPERTFIRSVAKPVSMNRQESEDGRVRTFDDESSQGLPPKKRGRKPGSQITKDLDPFPVRRSFRQLDLAQNHARQLNSRRQRLLTRQEDIRTLKRRGRKPRWLLEELAAQAENSAPREGKKPGRKPKQFKDLAVETPVIEITMELSYPDNEVDLPADVQCRSMATSHTYDESNLNPCRESPPKLCVETPNSHCHVLLEPSSLSWRERAMSTEESFIFQAQESVVFVKKFHSYAKVPEDEEISRLCALGDNAEASGPPVLEKERPLEAPTPSENPPKLNTLAENKLTSLTPAVAQDTSTPLGGIVDTNELPVLEKYPCQASLSLTPGKDDVGIPDYVVHNGTSGPPGDETTNTMADTMPTLESALEIAADKFHSSDNTLNKASDSICPVKSGLENATSNVSFPGNTHESPVNTTPSSLNAPQMKADTIHTPEKLTYGKENASSDSRQVGLTLVPKNVSEIPSSPKIQEKKPQETVLHKACEAKHLHTMTPSVTRVRNSSAPVRKLQPKELVHKCRLCNKESASLAILTHAFLHYRLEKRCMFCLADSGLGRPLGHFKKHIKHLRDPVAHVEEKKCEGSAEPSAKPEVTVQEAVPKKARPGLAQIKSKLLMRLNFRREATTQKAEKSTDDRSLLKLGLTKKPAPVPEPKKRDSEVDSDEEDAAEKKIIYLTRGLVKNSRSKSKLKARFLRKRLARKAKTGTSMAERDVSVPRDGSADRHNGVICKKQKIHKMKQDQGESNHVNEKNVLVSTKRECKEPKTERVPSEEKVEKKEAKHDENTKRDKTLVSATAEEKKSLNTSQSEAKRKIKKLHKSGIEKKKSKLADQKENKEKTEDADRKEHVVQKKDSNQKEHAKQKDNSNQKKDAKTMKKRKLNIVKSDEKQNKTNHTDKPAENQKIEAAEAVEAIEAVVKDLTKEENRTQVESIEIYQSVHTNKKQVKAPAIVNCPREPCTFHGRAGPVLSHVLIHHPGDLKALEFFYNYAKQKCIFCNRRIWTSQHFFNHVVCHRGNLKHPCYDIDCKQRFKTRLDLADHMIKDHNPLKAVCSFTGCTMQFNDPKTLYSHEREHYKGIWEMPLTKNDVPPDKTEDQSSCPPEASPKTSSEGLEICAANPEMQPLKGTEQDRIAAPANVEEEMPLTLNKGSVSYTKNLKLVNGHSDHEQGSPVKPPAQPQKDQEAENKAVGIKPFVRPPPSAYLDELFISMPKRWKGPQVSYRGSLENVEPSIKRQACPRCSASFNSEEELQGHREKCTSLFGFDSDDEGAF